MDGIVNNVITFSNKKKSNKNCIKSLEIVNFEQAPEYLKGNEFIKTGYLLNCNSFSQAFSALFICHNDTVTIWILLFGAIIAFILVFYTTSLVGNSQRNFLSQFDYEILTSEIKEIINKFLSMLNKDSVSEINNNGKLINNYIKEINIKSNNFLNDFGDRFTIINIMSQYIYSIQTLVEKIYDRFHYIYDNHVKTNINLGWDICKNKLLDLLRGNNNDEQNQLLINEENQPYQWPLYIMLVSAINCLGFTSLFHLFGSRSKNTYKVLSFFSYTSVIFLIAASCYPPYYYFFYCESCKLRI